MRTAEAGLKQKPEGTSKFDVPLKQVTGSDKQSEGQLVLVILDGWGLDKKLNGWADPANRKKLTGNAIAMAKTPNMDWLWASYPHLVMKASGDHIGLRPADPTIGRQDEEGNSEVGHMNTGSGQKLTLSKGIDEKLADGSFFENPTLRKVMQNAVDNGRPLHIFGMVSDMGVHNRIDHMFGLFELAKRVGVKDVLVHAFTDGRDTVEKNEAVLGDGTGYFEKVVDGIKKFNAEAGGKTRVKVASIMGRSWGMDRNDENWDKTVFAYKSMRFGVIVDDNVTVRTAKDPIEAVKAAYTTEKKRGEFESDEDIVPTLIVGADGKPIGIIRDGDSVIAANFRKDRMIQITKCFVEDNLWDKKHNPVDLKRGPGDKDEKPEVAFTGLTYYYDELRGKVGMAFTTEPPKNTLSDVLYEAGRKSWACAESNKYSHVTQYFAGGERDKPLPNEVWDLVESPTVVVNGKKQKIQTVDLWRKPGMSAAAVADHAVDAISSGNYDFVRMNFANPDMIGHCDPVIGATDLEGNRITSSVDSAKFAVEAVDRQVGRIVEACQKTNSTLIITADHGNAEVMINQKGTTSKKHTNNDVPFIVIPARGTKVELASDDARGRAAELRDIAPTILTLMNLKDRIPKEMTGKNLATRITHANTV
ncbi:MAG: 2,3-bisphosphoglycerate-independent phosphoglycerate mutase [Candidatus Altiarchaeota archaeon]